MRSTRRRTDGFWPHEPTTRFNGARRSITWLDDREGDSRYATMHKRVREIAVMLRSLVMINQSASDGATAQGIRDDVRPERRYHPPGSTGFRKKAMRRVRKATAQCYQLLSGHAAIGSSLHDRMTGPRRLESDECWWCRCGKRQSQHHLFIECRA